jgi:hypothetical protein
MSDEYGRGYLSVPAPLVSTGAPDQAPSAAQKAEKAETTTVVPNRPSDTISFFALAFIAFTLAYWLLLKGDTFETAFLYALGAGVLGSVVGVLVVLANRVFDSFSDWIFRLLPWAVGMCVLVIFLGDKLK